MINYFTLGDMVFKFSSGMVGTEPRGSRGQDTCCSWANHPVNSSRFSFSQTLTTINNFLMAGNQLYLQAWGEIKLEFFSLCKLFDGGVQTRLKLSFNFSYSVCAWPTVEKMYLSNLNQQIWFWTHTRNRFVEHEYGVWSLFKADFSGQNKITL